MLPSEKQKLSSVPDAQRSLRVGLVVAEPSGDLLAEGLMRALRRRVPEVVFEGIGGERMLAQGLQAFSHMDNITLMGLEEGIGKIGRIWNLRRRFKNAVCADPPDIFVGVDAPDFNLYIETALKAQAVPTVHYVSPTVWAWRSYRLKAIRRAVDQMLTLFPFEKQFYDEAGIKTTYVGHPAAAAIRDIDRDQARSGIALEGSSQAECGPVLALLPGSRRSELKRLLAPQLAAAHLLHQRYPEMRFVMPVAKATLQKEIEAACSAYPTLPLLMVAGRSREVLCAADFALLASGTAALEALLAGTPMVVVYQVSARTEWLVRRFGHVTHYSLPNHLLPEPMVPELIQAAVTPERMADAVSRYLDAPEEARKMKAAFAQVAETLHQASDSLAADAVLETWAASRSAHVAAPAKR